MATAVFMLPLFELPERANSCAERRPLLTISDTQSAAYDIEGGRRLSSSHYNCNTAATRIARSFHAAIGETACGMHAAEEQIPLRPGVRLVVRFEQGGLHGLGQPRLEADLATLFHVQPWRVQCILETHAEVEQIDGNLQDGGAYAVRAAGAERDNSAVRFQDDGRRHHGREPHTFAPRAKAAR